MICLSLSKPNIAAYETNMPKTIAPTTMYQVTEIFMIWYRAKNATKVTAIATKKATIFVGSLP